MKSSFFLFLSENKTLIRWILTNTKISLSSLILKFLQWSIMSWYFYYGKIGFRFVEESILGEIRAFSYLPIYSTHVLSISLHGILESTDALEADTYDTRCNRGNTIKRICAPQPGAIEPRRNVPWNRPIVSIFIPHTRWSFTRYR